MRKRLGVLVLVLVFVLAMAGCDDVTTSNSVGGASLIFGLEIDESTLEIPENSTTFAPGQEIYYVFNNNEAFGSNQLTIQLLNADTDEILLEQSYDVTAENTMYANTIGFNNAGKYQAKMIINGKTRAQQELIIQ
ncbi:MAG: hypothetical protein PHD40_08690 [Syntrophomonadaceae bacterium]|nr:hypothetical protein [Syntrophomonadaceae bacterium]